MAKKQQKPTKEQIVEKTIAMAAERGWGEITLTDIAEENGLTLDELREHFDDKSDILAAFGRMVDRRVLKAVGKAEEDASPRDRLFDLLMERFDVLNEYRSGLVRILDSFKLDPKQAVINLPHLCKSMNWMLEAAAMDASGLSGAVRLSGLSLIYIKALRVWKNDNSPDMAKVMAALDKDLQRADSLANSIGL